MEVSWGSSSCTKNGCQIEIGLARKVSCLLVKWVGVGLEQVVDCYVLVRRTGCGCVGVVRFVDGTKGHLVALYFVGDWYLLNHG